MKWSRSLFLLLVGWLVVACHREPPSSGNSNPVCTPDGRCYQITVDQSCAVISEQGEWTEYRCWQRKR